MYFPVAENKLLKQMFVPKTPEMSRIQHSLERLEKWVERSSWMGFDTHDALNSQLLRRLSFGNRFLGIIFIQILKRLPINLRPALGIKRDYNPKGMGLFLSSYLKKYQFTGDEIDLLKAEFLIEWLKGNASIGYSGYCWGYNFDWMDRSFFTPAGTPTVVNTSFIASAFLDAYDVTQNAEHLHIARSACNFFLKDLNIVHTNDGMYFSYTPFDERCVHNANALASATLAKVYHYTDETELLDYAKRAMDFTINHQRPNGSWPYGEGSMESWMDNYHTGFVLEAIADFTNSTHVDDYKSELQSGYRFFRDNFFLTDATPKYYHNRTYPIDIHSVAQSILTLLKLQILDAQAVDFARNVAIWGIDNMQDREGYFHYQIRRSYRIRIPYIRWGQAWMQKALATLIAEASIEHSD